MVIGKFEELNESGVIKENGISHSSTISLEFIDDKKISQLFMSHQDKTSIRSSNADSHYFADPLHCFDFDGRQKP